jgi:hypothetical protein
MFYIVSKAALRFRNLQMTYFMSSLYFHKAMGTQITIPDISLVT